MRRLLSASWIGLLCLGALVVTLVVYPTLLRALPQARAERAQSGIQRSWCRLVLKALNIKVDAEGVPAPAPVLWSSNHISWIDVLVLKSLRDVRFLAKQEVAHWPLIGLLAARTGTLFVRRGDARSTRDATHQMAWALRRNETLVLFPEGTTTDGKQLLRFQPRLYQAACMAQAPVQGVALRYAGQGAGSVPFIGDDAFVPHLWRLLGTGPAQVVVHFCTVHASLDQTRDQLAARTQQEIAESLWPELQCSGQGSTPGRTRTNGPRNNASDHQPGPFDTAPQATPNQSTAR